MNNISMTSWDHGLTCLVQADLFSQAEINARPDTAYNPWICNHRNNFKYYGSRVVGQEFGEARSVVFDIRVLLVGPIHFPIFV